MEAGGWRLARRIDSAVPLMFEKAEGLSGVIGRYPKSFLETNYDVASLEENLFSLVLTSIPEASEALHEGR